MRKNYFSKDYETDVEVDLEAMEIISELSVVSLEFMLDLKEALDEAITQRKIDLNGARDRRRDYISVESTVTVEIDRDELAEMFTIEDELDDYCDENRLMVIGSPKYLTARLELEDDLRKLNEKFKSKYGEKILNDETTIRGA